MARYHEAVCRQCRREGEKLFLKGDRCFTEKCSVERRRYAPGQHGQNMRSKLSDYGVQLRAKQKVRRMYGVLEGQFRKYYERGDRMATETGTAILQFLERRLDNVVYRLGYAPSRRFARQIVTHGHVLVNGRKAGVPSTILRAGDVVSLKESMKKNAFVQASMESATHRGVPSWLLRDVDNLKGTVDHIPARNEIDLVAQEQLIVELYSK